MALSCLTGVCSSSVSNTGVGAWTPGLGCTRESYWLRESDGRGVELRSLTAAGTPSLWVWEYGERLLPCERCITVVR